MPDNKAIDKHVLGNQVTQGDFRQRKVVSDNENIDICVLGNQVTQTEGRDYLECQTMQISTSMLSVSR